MGKVSFSLMVNDTIAQEIQKLHHLREKPYVVRNIPPYWNIDEDICLEQRKLLCETLKLPIDTFFVMYHGGLTSGRGIEKLIEATKDLEGVAVLLLGYGNQEYIQTLKEFITKLSPQPKVSFLAAVPYKDLWKYLGIADVGMVTIENVCLSYYYSLPNKLFENIQSLTPVIGSNFPEIRHIIENYNIGLICDPSNTKSITDCIIRMRSEKKEYNLYIANLKDAKKTLCWENEKLILKKTYTNIISN